MSCSTKYTGPAEESGRICRVRIRWMTASRTASYASVSLMCSGAVSASAFTAHRGP
ncbi:hypothetical protein [Streptomyces sp. NPDC002587]